MLKIETAGLTGILPDFIIIGAQKSGTTSLYEYLIKHPYIYSASVKEVGYFDRYYSNGIKWYRSHFPSLLRKFYTKNILRQPFITGEASTGYILNPHALKRISEILPQEKLIVLLRNPVERAYSHYWHTVKLGKETLSFEEALKREEERIGDAWKQMLCNENYYNPDISLYAYIHTAHYIDQIKVLMDLFPKKQILILDAKNLEMAPSSTFRQVLEFLNMPCWVPKEFKKYNVSDYSKEMDSAVRKWLVDYFKPYNRRLFEYLDVDFGWN